MPVSLPNVMTLGSPLWQVSDSYGRYALEVKQILEAEGVTVNTVGVEAPNRQFVPTLINLLMGYPTNFEKFGGIANIGIKIALTMWESTVLPPGWVEILNTCHLVIVPCQWNVEVFRANGVTAPIRLIPLGISSSTYHYADRQPKPSSEPFRFLVIGNRFFGSFYRKGCMDAMNAFVKTFGDRRDVELVIKGTATVLMPLSNPNIRIISEIYDEAQMQALYESCDCMIWASKGEGFSLPPREFALTGGISLCTNFSGTADDLPQWGIPLDYQLVPAWAFHAKFEGVGEWADVDGDHLGGAMEAVRNMPFALRKDLGTAFSQNVERLYRWQDFGRQLVDAITTTVEKAHLEDANLISA